MSCYILLALFFLPKRTGKALKNRNQALRQSMSVLDKVKSIFKKDGDSKASSPVRGNGGGPKIWTMPPEMQREFEKGVKYNMRVILRGLRRTGKSALLARLHGHPFPFDKYTPSPEISAATIRYQGMEVPEDQGTKVELWDVVDVGLQPPGASSSASLCPLADATTIDVYRGCHCVVFLVDPARRESLDYVVSESRNVPQTCAILVALNFMDTPRAAHQVSERDVDDVCRRIQRASTPMILVASQGNPPERSLSASATWVSISAKTGYGVSVLKSFFEIPVAFVHLAALETQMKGIYQKIETHQAWMLSERARLNYEEKEKSRSSEELQPPSPTAPPGTTAPASNVSRQAVPEEKSLKKESGETILVVIPPKKATAAAAPAAPAASRPTTAKQKQRDSEPEDSSKLSNDFFGDISDEDDKEDESSSSSDDDVLPAPSPSRRLVQPTQPPLANTGATSAAVQPLSDSSSRQVRDEPAPARVQQPVLQTFSATNAGIVIQTHRAPVLQNSDLDVDDAGKKVSDDFFGSDSDSEHSAARVHATGETSDDEQEKTAAPSVQQQIPTVAVSERPTAHTLPARVSDDFFGDDGSDEEEGRAQDVLRSAECTAPSAPPAPSKSHDPESDDDSKPQVAKTKPVDSDGEEAPTTSGRTSQSARVPRSTFASRLAARQPAQPTATKPAAVAPAIDVAALLAQMQNTIAAAPTEKAVDENEPSRDAQLRDDEKRHKKEKSDKKDKKSKKEKKIKKSKSSDSEDGGFVVEA